MIALSLFADASPPPRPVRRGRPPASSRPDQRERHIACASLHLGGKPAREVADLFGISQASVYVFTARALSYEGPRADALRKAHRRRIAN